MIINDVAIDWVTLTTYSKEEYNRALDTVLKRSKEWQSRGVQGYRGVAAKVRGGTIFVGKGRVIDREHFMIRVSSELADELSGSLNFIERCSRIDLQLTMRSCPPTVEGLNRCYKRMAEEVRANVNERSGAKRKVVLVLGDNAANTLYVGSRTSDIFIRIYQKEDEDGKKWTRLEVELKRKEAREVWSRMCSAGDAVQLITRERLLRSILTLPDSPLIASHVWELGKGTVIGWSRKESVKERDNSEWIKLVLLPNLSKYVEAETAEEAVLEVVNKLGRRAERRLLEFVDDNAVPQDEVQPFLFDVSSIE